MASSKSFDPVRLSKLLCFALRHRPDALGLQLTGDGWVECDILIQRVNASRRLPFTLEREQLESLVMGEGSARFELVGERLRARAGHSIDGVEVPPPDEAIDLPAFLYVAIPRQLAREARLAGDSAIRDGWLAADPGDVLSLRDHDPDALETDTLELAVVDAPRAERLGAMFRPGPRPGTFEAPSLPLRAVLSVQSGFERQISAGGVLARGLGGETQFALIRTMPRSETQAFEPSEIVDPRAPSDRRATDRRRGENGAPPDGVERRRTDRRRTRRRRRSARWGPDGRLELPKGKLEQGETPEQAALREVHEEMGFDDRLEVVESLAKNHYVFRTPEGETIFKTVHYYLLRCSAEAPEFHPRREEGIVAVEWWNGERAIAQVAFHNLRPVLERAWELSQAGGEPPTADATPPLSA